MDELMVRVCVAAHSQFSIRTIGNYTIEQQNSLKRFIPENMDKCRMIVDNIKIGIDFHWQQEVTMELPGVVEIDHHDDGSKTLINILPIDTYLTSVISSEMNAAAPVEFLKAHAIISRSWVMGKINHTHDDSSTGKIDTGREIVTWEDTSDHEGYDVCADDHCQRYQGVARVNDVVRKAVAETSGIVIADKTGRVIDARFSKCCGGRTELFSSCWQSSDKEYLQSFDDPYCNPLRHPQPQMQQLLDSVLMKYDRLTTDYYEWEERVHPQEVEKSMKEIYGMNTGKIQSLSVEERGPSERVKKLKITGEKGDFYVGKELAIRRLLSKKCLYSSAFNVTREDEYFLLRGRGWGHGVGMCQIGAAVMAYEGADHQQILKFYYPNTKLIKI